MDLDKLFAVTQAIRHELELKQQSIDKHDLIINKFLSKIDSLVGDIDVN